MNIVTPERTNLIARFRYVQLLYFRYAGHISQADFIRHRNVWRTQWNCCNTKQIEREANAIGKKVMRNRLP